MISIFIVFHLKSIPYRFKQELKYPKITCRLILPAEMLYSPHPELVLVKGCGTEG
jgi:hypothetical protein